MNMLFQNALIPGLGRKDVRVNGKKITEIAEPLSLTAKRGERKIDCDHRLMVPGLYNLHTHAAMNLFRSYGEDLPLDRWLNEKILPAEDKLTSSAVYTGTSIAFAEMIRTGTVSCSDMYFFSEDVVRAALDTGIKMNIGRSLVSFDENADFSKDPRFLESRRVYEKYNGAGEGQVLVEMCLHAEYSNVEAGVREVAAMAKEYGAPIMLHLSETEKEQNEGIARRGMTPLAFFDKCGILDSRVSAAHCVWVSDEDIALMAKKGVTAVHNPCSNLKLGSGVMPYGKLRAAGVNVALGTDGSASNNTLDMFKEMYTASILHKGVTRRPTDYTASEFLKMATENGAKAQGREECGKIAVGYDADIVLLDTDAENVMPVYDPCAAAVYAAKGENVKMTVVAGRVLYENGEYKTIDIEKLKADMRNECENICQKIC